MSTTCRCGHQMEYHRKDYPSGCGIESCNCCQFVPVADRNVALCRCGHQTQDHNLYTHECKIESCSCTKLSFGTPGAEDEASARVPSGDRRDMFAAAALQGLSARIALDSKEITAARAVEYADALIAELDLDRVSSCGLPAGVCECDKPRAPRPTAPPHRPCSGCVHFKKLTTEEPCTTCIGDPDNSHPKFEPRP